MILNSRMKGLSGLCICTQTNSQFKDDLLMEEDRKQQLMYIKSLSGDTFGNGTHVFTLHMVDFHVTVVY